MTPNLHGVEGMTSKEMVDLATRMAVDLKNWSEEATRRNLVSTEELTLLRNAASTIERATERAAVDAVNDTAEQQQRLTGESVTTLDDTLGG